MVFEHDARKHYEFVWFLALLNIFPQQQRVVHKKRGRKNLARQKPYEFIGFPIIMLEKHIKT